MNKVLAALILFVCLASPVFGEQDVEQDVEQQKIAYLIASIADLKDASFVRNGKAYDAERAADHLRLKLSRAGDRVKTAEDFITYCATGSSTSGVKYEIRFGDGRAVDSATFLRGKLAEYNAEKASGTR